MLVHPEKVNSRNYFLKSLFLVLPVSFLLSCSANDNAPLHNSLNTNDNTLLAKEELNNESVSSYLNKAYPEGARDNNSVVSDNSLIEQSLLSNSRIEMTPRVKLGDNSVSMEVASTRIINNEVNIGEEKVIEEFIFPVSKNSVEHKAFIIENPKRLVLDIFEESFSKTANFKLDSSNLFSKVRFGSHPKKKRVVFDFREIEKEIAYNVESKSEELVLKVSEPENLEIVKALNARNNQAFEADELEEVLADVDQNQEVSHAMARPDFEMLEKDKELYVTNLNNQEDQELELSKEEVEDLKLGKDVEIVEEEIEVSLKTEKEEDLILEELTEELKEEKISKEENKVSSPPKIVSAKKILPQIDLVSERKNLIEDKEIDNNIEDFKIETDLELVKNEVKEDKPTPLQLNENKEELAKEEVIEDTRALVKVLELNKVKPGINELVVGLNESRYYSFKQTSPTEYQLVLNNSKFENKIEDILSVKDDGKIRNVRTRLDGDNIIVNIVAAPESLLMTQADGSKVYVRSITTEKDVLRAQQKEADEKKSLEEDIEIEEDELELVSDEDDLTEFFTVDQKYTGRLISLDLQDTEIDNALRIIAEVSNLNIISSEEVTGKVTLRLVDVPWDQALDVILKTNGLDKVQEGNVIRIAPVEKLRLEREALRQAKQAEEELEPLKVQYVRVSYAKAAELQPLIETVITERGTVAYDERSNQIIVKDISKGLKNVAKLVEKLDLRTPQVLIETQIVEANRSFVRELGSELGFFYLRSPETGNALGSNFPNTVQIGGTAIDSSGTGQSVAPGFSFFPASNAASAVSALFGSADGTKGLQLRLTQAETEGDVRTISRPSVAVTNNSPAVIKSVTKLRVRLPNGGVTVSSGQGAQAQGQGANATETIEVGIILNVTAQASPDYYVLMDIEAKSSTLGPLSLGVEQIPPEIERSATSSVLVSSGQTFAMGGIYRVSEDDNTVGVPFLKNIPFLGQFFRRTTVDNTDEELIFFITPRIIEGSFDDASMNKIASK